MLGCKDIPAEVWKEVRDKWRKVETSEYIDWNECALCNYMERESSIICYDCPLMKYSACNGWPGESKLHIMYWDDDEEKWYEYVQKFLIKLDKLIEELES